MDSGRVFLWGTDLENFAERAGRREAQVLLCRAPLPRHREANLACGGGAAEMVRKTENGSAKIWP